MKYIFDVSKGKKENTVGSLRNLCSSIIKSISSITKLSINNINQIECWIGRSICIKGNPDCNLESNESQWLKKEFPKCPYSDECYALNYNNEYLQLNEPEYNGSSY